MSDDRASAPDGRAPAAELDHLREELRLARTELARAREKEEAAVERRSRLRRAKLVANRESQLLARELADALHREARDRASGPRWRLGRRRVRSREWDEVMMIRESDLFRPVWYLRQNLDVARMRMDPAVHFLRQGYKEGRDPGPNFSLEEYLDQHPEVRDSGENPLLHYLRHKDEFAPSRGKQD